MKSLNLCIPGDITQKGYEKKKQRLLASYNISSSNEVQSRKSGEISTIIITINLWIC
jgi:hypothetical protein